MFGVGWKHRNGQLIYMHSNLIFHITSSTSCIPDGAMMFESSGQDSSSNNSDMVEENVWRECSSLASSSNSWSVLLRERAVGRGSIEKREVMET